MRLFKQDEPPQTLRACSSVYISSYLDSFNKGPYFIQKYFPDVNLSEKAASETQADYHTRMINEYRTILLDLSDEQTHRCYLAEQTSNRMAKLGIVFGTLISVLEFTRSILQNNAHFQTLLKYFSYVEAGLGLLFALYMQLLDRQSRIHHKAADQLTMLFETYRKEYDQFIQNHLQLIHNGTTHQRSFSIEYGI